MKIVDLNLLLYVIDRDSAHHRTAREWWESALAGDEPVGLPWIVLLGFLRLATNPRVFPSPLPVEVAVDHVDRWLAHPTVRLVVESDQHWTVLRRLIAEVGAAANLTTDAHLAAIAESHGATLVSFDADFGRFPKLRWEDPLRRSSPG